MTELLKSIWHNCKAKNIKTFLCCFIGEFPRKTSKRRKSFITVIGRYPYEGSGVMPVDSPRVFV